MADRAGADGGFPDTGLPDAGLPDAGLPDAGLPDAGFPHAGLPHDEGLSADGAWVELSVAADPEAVEAVSEILARATGSGVSVEPAFELVDEGLGARVDPTRPAMVRAHLPGRDPAAVRAAVRQAAEALGHLQAFGLRPIGELETRVVHESDWAEAWKRHVGVMRIGRRIVIRPSWRRHRALVGDVVLALDPGMAFGTGLHPTTRLCLAGLERWADEGLLGVPAGAGGALSTRPPRGPSRRSIRVLDVGSGSGILGIAAARLGADEVLAVDTDPIAVEATLANARRNHVLRRLRVRRGSVPTGAGPFNLMAANLIASLLVSLAPLLHDELAPGGRLLASGIFVDREGEVCAAFEDASLAVLGRSAEGDWVALEARRDRAVGEVDG